MNFDIMGFLTATPWWVLLLIYVVKTIEVTISTMRIILIQRGFRKLGTLLAFIEVLLWVFVAASVVQNINEAPVKAIVYSIGFATGVFLGSLIESKLAFGHVLVQVISSEPASTNIVEMVRSRGSGATEIDGKGLNTSRKVLLVYVERSETTDMLSSIRSIDPKAVVGVSDVNNLSGGYLPKRQRFIRK